MEWARIEYRCPTCKQRFKSIRRPRVPGLFACERFVDVPHRDQCIQTTLDVAPDSRSIHLHTEIDYRYFTLRDVSISVDESLNASYTRFIKSRIECVRAGDKWGCMLGCLWMKLVCSCRWGCQTSSLPAGSVAREPELFDEMPQRE